MTATSNKSVSVLVVSCVLLGVVVRVIGLDSSLWLDEFVTLWAVESTWGEVFHRTAQVHAQTPFYYILTWSFLRALGESEIALRVPSLLCSVATAVVVAATARLLANGRAAVIAALAVWVSAPIVAASVNARPYALALFATAVMLYGFTRAALVGDTRSRLAFVAGSVMLIWSHFLLGLAVPALAISYGVAPALRTRYAIRRFSVDLIAIAGLAALALPQFLSLWQRRHGLSWISTPQHGAVVALLGPFLIGALMAPRQVAPDATRRSLRVALWAAIVLPVVVIEGAMLGGLNLVAGRYLSAIVIPAAVLAATSVAVLPRRDVFAAVLAFLVPTAAAFGMTYGFVGTFSGAGAEDWRRATQVLRSLEGDNSNVLVLYRSGLVEEDTAPALNAAADQAPLRSPGMTRPNWLIAPLTYRWTAHARAAYFDSKIVPLVDGASRFYFLGLPFAEHGIGAYTDNVIRWVNQRWPGRYNTRRIPAGRNIELIAFERVAERRDQNTMR